MRLKVWPDLEIVESPSFTRHPFSRLVVPLSLYLAISLLVPLPLSISTSCSSVSTSLFASLYIYISALELKTGPRFGVSSVKTGPSLVLKTGPSFFFAVFPQFYSVLGGIFRNTNSATVCQNSVFLQNLGGCQKWGFRKENCIFCFFLFYVGDLETEKRKKNGKGQKTPIK